MGVQAFYVKYRSPTGSNHTWVVISDDDNHDECISPELVAGIRETICGAQGYEFINILEVSHLDRAIVLIGSVKNLVSRLHGGFGGGTYRKVWTKGVTTGPETETPGRSGENTPHENEDPS